MLDLCLKMDKASKRMILGEVLKYLNGFSVVINQN
jgi:hypothetical protein